MMTAMIAFISFVLTYITIDVIVGAIRRRRAK